jgi:hypothetical protein
MALLQVPPHFLKLEINLIKNSLVVYFKNNCVNTKKNSNAQKTFVKKITKKAKDILKVYQSES